MSDPASKLLLHRTELRFLNRLLDRLLREITSYQPASAERVDRIAVYKRLRDTQYVIRAEAKRSQAALLRELPRSVDISFREPTEAELAALISDAPCELAPEVVRQQELLQHLLGHTVLESRLLGER